VVAPLLIQEVTDLRATRTDYLLSIKLLKEPAAPVEEWSLHPRSGSKVEWVVPMCESLPMQQLELEGVEGDSDEPARRQYVLLRAPAQEALESDSHVTMLYRSMAAGAAFSGQEPTDGDSSPAHRTDSEVCQTQYVFRPSGRVVYSFEERCLGAPKIFASGGASQRACGAWRFAPDEKVGPPSPSVRTGPEGEWMALESWSGGGVGLEEPGVEVVPAPHNTELTDVITHTGRHRAGRALLCVIYAPLLSVHLVYQPRSFNLASRSGCTFPEPAAAALKLVRVMRLVLSVNNRQFRQTLQVSLALIHPAQEKGEGG
jgi:hypothetical protein